MERRRPNGRLAYPGLFFRTSFRELTLEDYHRLCAEYDHPKHLLRDPKGRKALGYLCKNALLLREIPADDVRLLASFLTQLRPTTVCSGPADLYDYAVLANLFAHRLQAVNSVPPAKSERAFSAKHRALQMLLRWYPETVRIRTDRASQLHWVVQLTSPRRRIGLHYDGVPRLRTFADTNPSTA